MHAGTPSTLQATALTKGEIMTLSLPLGVVWIYSWINGKTFLDMSIKVCYKLALISSSFLLMVVVMMILCSLFFYLSTSHCYSDFIANISVHKQFFPDEEDQKGAAKALMRLQDTYHLDSESFSKGRLPG